MSGTFSVVRLISKLVFPTPLSPRIASLRLLFWGELARRSVVAKLLAQNECRGASSLVGGRVFA